MTAAHRNKVTCNRYFDRGLVDDNQINVKKTVVYTRVNGALHIENCKNYKKVITHQHIA